VRISKDFINSVINAISIKEPLGDILESIVDLETESEFIKNIPVIGWIFKAVGVVDKIKTKFLVQKILLFLNELSSITDEERESFEKKNFSTEKEIESFYEVLLISIERLNHLEKAKILSTLFKCVIKNEIDKSFFLRSNNIVEGVYIDDLIKYLNGKIFFSYSENYQEANPTQVLLSYGLLTSYLVNQESAVKRVHQESDVRFHFVNSPFGLKFIKACNYK
jgi:hypothetical protein